MAPVLLVYSNPPRTQCWQVSLHDFCSVPSPELVFGICLVVIILFYSIWSLLPLRWRFPSTSLKAWHSNSSFKIMFFLSLLSMAFTLLWAYITYLAEQENRIVYSVWHITRNSKCAKQNACGNMGSQNCSWFLLRLSSYLWPYKAVIQLCSTTQQRIYTEQLSIQYLHITWFKITQLGYQEQPPSVSLALYPDAVHWAQQAQLSSGLTQLCCFFWTSTGSSAWPLMSCITAPNVAHPQSLLQNGINQA